MGNVRKVSLDIAYPRIGPVAFPAKGHIFPKYVKKKFAVTLASGLFDYH